MEENEIQPQAENQPEQNEEVQAQQTPPVPEQPQQTPPAFEQPQPQSQWQSQPFFAGNGAPQPQPQAPLQKVGFFKRDLGLSSITGGLSYSLAVLLYLGVSLLVSFLNAFINLNVGEGGISDALMYALMLVSPLAICITLAVIIPTRKVRFKAIFQPKTHPKYFLMAALLTLGTLFIGSIISNIFLSVLEIFGYEASESFLPDVSGAKIIPAIIFIAIFPAFFEELLFRGLILHSAEKSMGSVRAILVTGFCFALMHGSPMQTVHQFMLGCLLGLLTIRSGSVLPAMLMHFLNNLIAVIMLALPEDWLEAVDTVSETPSPATMIFGLVVLASIGAAIGTFIWLMHDKKKPMTECKTGEVRPFFIGASVGIALMGLSWLLDLFGIM